MLSLEGLPPFQRSWHLKGEDLYSSFMAGLQYIYQNLKEDLDLLIRKMVQGTLGDYHLANVCGH